MTARAIGDVLSGLAPAKQYRTFQPVRRNSYNIGDREHRIWKPFDPKEKGARMTAAEVFDRTNKQPGARNGPLGHIGLEVLRVMMRIINHSDGRLEPSIETIQTKIRRSRAAVVAALARLKQHGFIDWIRRSEPVEGDGPGPRVRQATNAYWFGIPETARKIFNSVLRRNYSPPPDDASHRDEQEKNVRQDMIERMPLVDQVALQVDDPQLADVLAAIARNVDEREFTKRSESGHQRII